MPAPVLVKKYGNRRLYDTGDSKYITLDELATKIRSGADVRVVDAQTSEDLTQATLTQIVLETGQAAKFLPVQLLAQMIRLSDDALAEFFSRYVTSALDLYLQAKRGAQTLASYNPLAQIPLAATDALTRLWMSNPYGAPYQQPPPQYGGYPSPPYVAPPPPPEPEPGNDRVAKPSRRGTENPENGEPGEAHEAEPKSSEMAAMRRELDELKQAIREGLAPRAAPRKKRKS
ncbi:MAG TPA: polyhydroxyalkanoate synthesis regulator DNA-binding domain-containing protein [Kofleriaceae bacterium]